MALPSPRRAAILSPLAALYGAGVGWRLAAFQRGIFSVRRAPRPVISVGNVAAGGTGKTPMVELLARELLARGRRPAVLTRGYRRRSRGPIVVSDGMGGVASVADSGDEAALMARSLPHVPILADARRARGASLLVERFPSVDVILLDDGFSHVGLSRDADVVLVDATDPSAGGALLPVGNLREPLPSLARADFLVITRTESADPSAALELCRRHAPGVPVFHAETRVSGIHDRNDDLTRPSDLPPGTFVSVCGIARPEAFRATLSSLGLEPTAFLEFGDHEPYGPADAGRIEREAEETGATAVVTTSKDAVKLERLLRLPIFTVRIATRVLEPEFVPSLLRRLEQEPS